MLSRRIHGSRLNESSRCIPLNTNSGYARTNLNRRTPAQFMHGRSTREEVILDFGEPDGIWRIGLELAYCSAKAAPCGFWWQRQRLVEGRPAVPFTKIAFTFLTMEHAEAGRIVPLVQQRAANS